jgi:hypothetical protein
VYRRRGMTRLQEVFNNLTTEFAPLVTLCPGVRDVPYADFTIPERRRIITAVQFLFSLRDRGLVECDVSTKDRRIETKEIPTLRFRRIVLDDQSGVMDAVNGTIYELGTYRGMGVGMEMSA